MCFALHYIHRDHHKHNFDPFPTFIFGGLGFHQMWLAGFDTSVHLNVTIRLMNLIAEMLT